MSDVEQKIVSMRVEGTEAFEKGINAAISVLDKLQDSLKFNGSTDGIDAIQEAVSDFTMNPVENALEEAGNGFGIFRQIAEGALSYVGQRIVDLGISMSRNLAGTLTKSARDGFGEYELQMKSIQTILSNAGEQLGKDGYETESEKIEVINQALDELNTYADKTIYNFSEMTRNIGTFTAAGVDLQTATTSIQGIANLAAASGSSSQQASTAMYQLSQAISTGALKLQDWNSVVNAGMGGTLFQEALKRTARVHGVAVDEMIEENGSFRESLQEGWITSDILTETLEQLAISYDEVGDSAYNAAMEQLKQQGYSEEDAVAILELAHNAEQAATKVRTWTQLWDTLGEAMGSGWSATWRTIVGDFVEATELFTFLSDKFSAVINASADARNKVLEDWAASGGRTALVDGIQFLVDAILSPITAIGKAFGEVFGISAEQLYNITTGFALFAEKLVPTKEVIQAIHDVFYDVFTVIHSVLGVAGNIIRIFVNVTTVVWNLIKPIAYLAGNAFALLLNVIARVSSGIQWFSDRVESVVSAVIKPLGYIGHNLSTLFINVGSAIANGFGSIFSSIVDKVSAFASNCEFLSTILSVLRTPLDVVVNALYGFNSVLVDLTLGKKVDIFEKLGLSPEIVEKARNIIDNLSRAWDSLKGAFSFLGSITEGEEHFTEKLSLVHRSLIYFTDSLHNFAVGVYDILPEPLKFVARMVKDVADAILGFPAMDAFKNFVSGLPRLLFDTIGAFKAEGTLSNKLSALAYGFDAFKDHLMKFTRSLFSSAPEALQKGVLKIVDIMKELWTSISSFVTNTKAYSMAKKFLENFFGADILKDGVSFGDKIVGVIDTIKRKFSEFRDYLVSPDFNIVELLKSMFGKATDIFKELTSDFDLGSLFQKKHTTYERGSGSSFGGFFTGIFDTLKDIISKLSPTLGEVFDNIANTFSYGKDNISKEIEKMNLSNFGDTFNLLVDSISSIPSKLGDLLGQIKDSVTTFFTDFPWPNIEKIKGIVDILGKIGIVALVSGFVLSLKKVADTISGFGKGIIDFPKNLGKALGNFGEGFNKWREETKADAILKIAGAIAIMAGALLVIASLPTEDLIKAGLAIGGLAVGMGAFIAIFGILDKLKVVNSSAMNALGTAMLGLGVGVLALSGAVLILSKVPVDTLNSGLGACVILILALSAFAKGMGSNGKSMLLGAAGMIIFAKALNLMAGVVENLASIDLKDWATNGLGAFVALIGILTLFGKYAADGIGNLLASFLKFGAGLILVGVSIGIFAVTILGLAAAINSLDKPMVVLGVLAGFLGAFTLICFALKGSDPAAIGAALMKFALGIGVMALALTLTSMGNWKDMLVAGGAMIVLLGIFAAMIHFFEASDIEKTANSILIFSASLGVMALALTYLSQTPWEQLGIGVLTIGALLLGLALLANFTKEADLVATSTALVIFSAAIGIVALGFKMLESVDVLKIIAPLGAAAVAFAVLAIGGRFLLGAVPGVLGISAAFWVFSDAIKNLAEAFAIFTGKVDFADISAKFEGFKGVVKGFGTNLWQAFTDGVKGFPASVSDTVDGLAGGFLGGLAKRFGIGAGAGSPTGQVGLGAVKEFATGMEAGLPDISSSTSKVSELFTNNLSTLPDISTLTAQDTMTGFIGELGSYDGDMTAQIDELMETFGSGFAEFPTSAEGIAGDGIEGFLAEFASGESAAKDASSKIGTSATLGIEDFIGKFKTKGDDGVKGFVDAITKGEGPARSAGSALKEAVKNGVGSLYDAMWSIGRNAGLGLYDGLNSMNQRIKDKSAEISRNIAKTTERTMEVKSPSKVMFRIGKFVGEGLFLGIAAEATRVYSASKNMAEQIPEGFNDTLTALSVDDMVDLDYSPVITPVIDSTKFDTGMSKLNGVINRSFSNISPIEDMDYNAQFGGKLDDLLDSNRQVASVFASNSIDYSLLGTAVANALIRAGVHVEMDGGELMGYLAGQIQDTRRMYS